MSGRFWVGWPDYSGIYDGYGRWLGAPDWTFAAILRLYSNATVIRWYQR